MEQRPPQHKMGILAVGRNQFSGNVYENHCPVCGVPPWYWCQSSSGQRLGLPHGERSGPVRMAKEQ